MGGKAYRKCPACELEAGQGCVYIRSSQCCSEHADPNLRAASQAIWGLAGTCPLRHIPRSAMCQSCTHG